MILNSIRKFLKIRSFLKNEDGVSALETAILFPVLFAMLMAIYDLGQGVVVNQKTVSAAQIMGDLVSRYEFVDTALVEDIITGGSLALDPYDKTPFGYDIISVIFDEDGNPEVLWRFTDNMDENQDAVDNSVGLGDEGQGVVIVSVNYSYTPFFTDFVINEFDMTEVSFLRGRKSPTVQCTDCL